MDTAKPRVELAIKKVAGTAGKAVFQACIDAAKALELQTLVAAAALGCVAAAGAAIDQATAACGYAADTALGAAEDKCKELGDMVTAPIQHECKSVCTSSQTIQALTILGPNYIRP